MDSYPGGLAGSLASLLNNGGVNWYFPDFDTTFVLPDEGDTVEESDEKEERIANGSNQWQNPGLNNVQAGAKGKFSLYPNPTNGNFITDCPEAGKLAIYTIDGRKVAEYEVTAGKTDLSLPKGLAPGVYVGRYKGSGKQPPVNKRVVYQP